jgi:5-methylcytosine-specific restriction endonuclease McrA
MVNASEGQESRPRGYRENRLLVLERDGNACRYCGDPATCVDHITPRAHLGSDDPENLVAACHPCNSRVSSQYFDSFEEKRCTILGERRILASLTR